MEPCVRFSTEHGAYLRFYLLLFPPQVVLSFFQIKKGKKAKKTKKRKERKKRKEKRSQTKGGSKEVAGEWAK